MPTMQFEQIIGQANRREPGVAPLLLAVPILPGKVEALRRMVQEIQGRRHDRYEEARQSLGVTGEAAWLLRMPRADVALVSLQARHPQHLLSRLAASKHPFDRWFREQLQDICGLELKVVQDPALEPLFNWQAPSGFGKPT